MSVHNHDEEIMKRISGPSTSQKLNEAFKDNNKSKWDSILTDAIELTEGSIKPYDRILKYLSEHYNVNRKP